MKNTTADRKDSVEGSAVGGEQRRRLSEGTQLQEGEGKDREETRSEGREETLSEGREETVRARRRSE